MKGIIRNFKNLKIKLLWFGFCISESTEIAIKFHIHWSTSDFVAASAYRRKKSLIAVDDSDFSSDPKVLYLIQT